MTNKFTVVRTYTSKNYVQKLTAKMNNSSFRVPTGLAIWTEALKRSRCPKFFPEFLVHFIDCQYEFRCHFWQQSNDTGTCSNFLQHFLSIWCNYYLNSMFQILDLRC